MINIYELFSKSYVEDVFGELNPTHMRILREFIVLESERCYWEEQAHTNSNSVVIQSKLVEVTLECMAVRLDVLDNSSPEVRDTACAILLELGR